MKGAGSLKSAARSGSLAPWATQALFSSLTERQGGGDLTSEGRKSILGPKAAAPGLGLTATGEGRGALPCEERGRHAARTLRILGQTELLRPWQANRLSFFPWPSKKAGHPVPKWLELKGISGIGPAP